MAKKKSVTKKPQQHKKSSGTITVFQPQFAEVLPSNDPAAFKIAHDNDNPLYNEVVKNLLQSIPPPVNPSNMVLTLEEVLGNAGKAAVNDIQKVGQIVFHAGGDTGPVKGPQTVELVADKMANDFVNEPAGEIPSFFFHLGDVVYSFGEAQYYYDQFYEPFRNYPAPIVAIPGNHDGLIYTGDNAPSLDAFIRNFVNTEPVHTPECGALLRTAMTQPGVYFAFDAPFVSIIGLYSNVLEDPGIISSEGNKSSPVTDEQITFLTEQLTRLKNSNNAVIVAVHHPPYSWGGNHGGSPRMLKDLDSACKKAGFWPHVILSGHAHNYQRFTRTVGNYDIPYVVCGNSGHNVVALKGTNSAPLRAPVKVSGTLMFENYDDANYGYLRIVCNSKTMRVEYHDATPGQKTYSDAVTVDLQSHTMISN
ncbi:MAG TPA: metallophosphoesterase [Flavipsychrobacter sp.]|nr:metallophosphoesterase [Flavipsychrobacter sp.]